MNAVAAASMMGAEFLAGGFDSRLAHLPSESPLHDIDGCRDGERRVLSLEEIDDRLAFRRHFFAQMIESVLAVEPDRIVVRPGHATPDRSFGFTEGERGS